MRSILLLSILIMLTGLLGCGHHQSAESEITSKIQALYEKQRTFYEIPLDESLFSDALIQKMENIRKMTEIDIARIKNSEYPTDKPFQFEGSTFTSISDGYSKYTIKEIAILGDEANVRVDFEYNSSPKEIWSDQVVLKNSGGWKIYNVLFSKAEGANNLLDRLNPSPESEIIHATLKNKSGQSITIDFDNIKNIATVNINNEKIIMNGQKPASGMWYTKDDYELRGKGDQITLTKGEKTIFTNSEETHINPIEAKNYFIKNNYKEAELHYLKITTKEAFNRVFGMGTTMGNQGAPTKIDFSKYYVIALIDKTSNLKSDIRVSITQTHKNISVVVFKDQENGTAQSYTSRPFKILMIENQYQGAINLEIY
jgi:frataxin-like iron-binding protein CyaY